MKYYIKGGRENNILVKKNMLGGAAAVKPPYQIYNELIAFFNNAKESTKDNLEVFCNNFLTLIVSGKLQTISI